MWHLLEPSETEPFPRLRSTDFSGLTSAAAHGR